MPEVLASALAGQAVDAEVHPEAPAGTLRLDLNALPDALPFLVGDDGTLWNGYWPARVFYTDAGGRTWRLPCHKIPIPARGYWARLQAGQSVKRSPVDHR